jgi:hypothetical protein
MGDICDYFHQEISCLISTEADYITFLSGDNKDKNIITKGIYRRWQLYYRNYFITRIFFDKNLYKGKGYELLSLYFNRTEDPNAEQCPF